MREHRYSFEMPHAAARIWALFQDYDRWPDYAPMVKRVDVLWPGDERPQRPAAAGDLPDAARAEGLGARARERRRARAGLHVHDDLVEAGQRPDRPHPPRAARPEPHPLRVRRALQPESAPFKWFEGQIYGFINKKNEESMRRASAWLTEHPEYRPDLVDDPSLIRLSTALHHPHRFSIRTWSADRSLRGRASGSGGTSDPGSPSRVPRRRTQCL